MTGPEDFEAKTAPEAFLQNVVRKHRAEIDRLRSALSQIAAIQNEQFGHDWDEIEQARKIAVETLGTPNPSIEQTCPGGAR